MKEKILVYDTSFGYGKYFEKEFNLFTLFAVAGKNIFRAAVRSVVVKRRFVFIAHAHIQHLFLKHLTQLIGKKLLRVIQIPLVPAFVFHATLIQNFVSGALKRSHHVL